MRLLIPKAFHAISRVEIGESFIVPLFLHVLLATLQRLGRHSLFLEAYDGRKHTDCNENAFVVMDWSKVHMDDLNLTLQAKSSVISMVYARLRSMPV